MSNHTVPAAAEGLLRPDFSDLEGDIGDLSLAAGVAKQLVCNKLFSPNRGQDYVSIGRRESEIIEHALSQVEIRACELETRFMDLLEAANVEAGR